MPWRLTGRRKRQDITPNEIEQTQARVSVIKDAFEKHKSIILEVIKAETNDSAAAQEHIDTVIGTLDRLNKDLEGIKRVLRVNDEVARYLFKPIRSAQNWSIIATVVFGIVGVLLASPVWISIFRGAYKSEQLTPDYFDELKLKNLRRNLADSLYADAISDSEALANAASDERIKSQALIYRVAAQLQLDSYSNVPDILAQIPETDEFITAQKILVTAVYHSKVNEYREASDLLQRVLDDERFAIFWPDAVHYQCRLESMRLHADEFDVKSFEKLNILNKRLGEFKADKLILDLSSGREIFVSELRRGYSKLIDEKKGQLEKEKRRAAAAELARHLRVAIRYNGWSVNGVLVSNPMVKDRAERIDVLLRRTYPGIQTNVSMISPQEIKARKGYWIDCYFLLTQKGKEFWNNYVSFARIIDQPDCHNH